MNSILMITLIAACFLAMALSLALEIQDRNRVMRMAAIVTGIIGIALYGYGYARCYGVNAVSILRALLALCRMFTGSSDLSAIQEAPLLQNGFVLAIFWIGHFLGFYVMASAVVATLGGWLLRRLRVTRLRRGPLLLVYGINANSIAYARHMARDKHRRVLFVDEAGGKAYESVVNAMGAIIESSGAALEPGVRFIRQMKLRAGKRRLEVAALHADAQKNMAYSLSLMRALQEAGVDPRQTTLLIGGIHGSSGELTALEGGYGSVMAFNDYEQTARRIVQEMPPCDMVRFDGRGKALEDMHVVIVGFRQMGRAMLSQFLMNGQFYGSRFRADVFDPDPQNGFLHDRAIARDYDIRFHGAKGTSGEFYGFLEDNLQSIRCIAVCTGDKEENAEMAEDLAFWLRHCDRPPVVIQAVRGAYIMMDSARHRAPNNDIYDSAALDIDRMDAVAKEINAMYLSGNANAAQAWEHCDYYSRASSRASADFYPAFLRASGRTADQVLSGDWPPDDETLERLAISEHLRWCAYLYVTGYEPMPEDVYAQRIERYDQMKREGRTPDFTIARDRQRRLHACLAPWESLDELSARENAVTGGHVDYKQLDRNNVLALAKVLAAARPGPGSNGNG